MNNDLTFNPALNLWVPRVTHVLHLLDKYALRKWYAVEAAKHGIRAGMSISFDEDLDLDNRAKACVGQVDQYVEATADFGTEVHQWLRDFNSGEQVLPTERITAVVHPWAAWFQEHVKQVYLVEQQVFGELDGLQYGGTLDLLCLLAAGTKLGHGGRTLYEDTLTWVDFKTGGEYYDDWGYQLAAYRHASWVMSYPYLHACVSVRLDREKPGKVYVKEWQDYDNNLAIFANCLEIWYRLPSNKRAIAAAVECSTLETKLNQESVDAQTAVIDVGGA